MGGLSRITRAELEVWKASLPTVYSLSTDVDSSNSKEISHMEIKNAPTPIEKWEDGAFTFSSRSKSQDLCV